jgi:hypothetical protein
MRFEWMIAMAAAAACGGDKDGPRLRGNVHDDNGKPIAGATVSVAGKTATTDAKGAFRISFDGAPPAAVEVSAPGRFVEKLTGPSLHFACDPQDKADCAITRPIELAEAPAADGVFATVDGKLAPLAPTTLTMPAGTTQYAAPAAGWATIKRGRSGTFRFVVRGDQKVTGVRLVEGAPMTIAFDEKKPAHTRTLAISGGGEATVQEYALPNRPNATWALGTFVTGADGAIRLEGDRAVLFVPAP